MADPDAVRQACQPIARWWADNQHSGRPDPHRLARAAVRARLLGPLPGPLGAALAYILAAPGPLDYRRLRAAFDTVTAAATADRDGLDRLLCPSPAVVDRRGPEQLSLAGIGAGSTAHGARRWRR